MRRCVILNADDFGQSPGINQGVAQAYEKGILTSASLMVRWPAAPEAAEYARRHPELSVGLHLDFGEWAFQNGNWIRLYQVVDENDSAAVSAEIERQLRAFERLLGRPPTHLDSHQRAHLDDSARSLVTGLAKRLDIPVRKLTKSVVYCGRFYGQDGHGASYPEGVSVEALLGILEASVPGLTEVSCHPAATEDLYSMYSAERILELDTLCDPRVRKGIEEMGIELKSFAGWRSYTDMSR